MHNNISYEMRMHIPANSMLSSAGTALATTRCQCTPTAGRAAGRAAGAAASAAARAAASAPARGGGGGYNDTDFISTNWQIESCPWRNRF